MSKLPPNLIMSSQHYDWFAALLLCESVHLNQKRIGDIAKPSEEYIRLGQKPTLLFPAQAIHTLDISTNPPWLTQYFFGVFGSNGALPLHLTEYAIDQEKYHKDLAFTHFINLFHHRALGLFYRGWRLAQPTADFLPNQALSFSKKIESLVGVAEFKAHNLKIKDNTDKNKKNELAKQENNPLEQRLSVLYQSYIFDLAGSSRSTDLLKLLLARCIQAPIEINTNITEFLDRQAIYYSLLGKNESDLGKNLQLGSKVLSAQSNIVIMIGPIDIDKYNQFFLDNYKNTFIDIVKKVVGLNFNIHIKFIVEKNVSTSLKDKTAVGKNFWLGSQKKILQGAILKI